MSPPELPSDGLAHHSTLISFHIEDTILGCMDSFLYSCMKTNHGWCLLMSFLSMALLTRAPRPLMFQDSTIIVSPVLRE